MGRRLVLGRGIRRAVDLDQNEAGGIVSTLNHVEARNAGFLNAVARVFDGSLLESLDGIGFDMDMDLGDQHSSHYCEGSGYTSGMRGDWKQAVVHGQVETVDALLRRGAPIDAVDRYGQTGLMLASLHGSNSVAELLIARGAALDRTAKYGLSALMLAVIRGHAEIVRLLLAAGADTQLRGTGAPGFADKSALDLALERGDRNTIDALQSHAPAENR